ncbi:MAG: hypothetical protein ACKVS8_07795 [Phycisphaerales bacterium]
MRAERAAGRGWAAAGAGLIAATLVWCGACAQNVAAPEAGVVAGSGGVLTLGPERPPSGTLTCRETSVDVPAAARYVSAVEDQPNGLLALRVDGPDGRISTTRVEVEPGASDASPVVVEKTRSTLDVRLRPDGALVVERSAEARDDALTVFEPALVAMPAVLTAGIVHRQEFSMVVHAVAQPAKVKARGEASQQIVYEADQAVTTPAGTFECRRVLTTFAAAPGPARVEVLTRSWYATGVGLVAETSDEQVWVLGVPFRSSRRSWAIEALKAPGSGVASLALRYTNRPQTFGRETAGTGWNDAGREKVARIEGRNALE